MKVIRASWLQEKARADSYSVLLFIRGTIRYSWTGFTHSSPVLFANAHPATTVDRLGMTDSDLRQGITATFPLHIATFLLPLFSVK